MTLLSRLMLLTLGGLAGASAQLPATWTEPFPPHKIAGNLYYVGSKDLASYLVATPEGHVLINSSLEESVPLIRASIEQLGFKFSDVKILLISHAHSDHCAGSAEIIRQTKARYYVMEADADAKGRKLHAVIIGSPNVNPGYLLVNNRDYPGIAADYERCFRVLKSLPVDLFLGAHGGYYDMTAKHARLGADDANPFLDPAGYHRYVADREQAFLTELARQQSR